MCCTFSQTRCRPEPPPAQRPADDKHSPPAARAQNARRNWHVDERDEAWNDDAGGEGDGEEGLAEAWQPDSAGDDAAARRESSSQATFRRRGGRDGQMDE